MSSEAVGVPPAASSGQGRTAKATDRPVSWRVLWVAMATTALLVNSMGSWRSTKAVMMDRRMSAQPSDGEEAQAGNFAASASAATAAGGTWHQPDWFDSTKWSLNPELGKSCPIIENICFQHQKWFYDTSASHHTLEQHGMAPIPDPRQPALSFKFDGNSGNAYFLEYDIHPTIPLHPDSTITQEEAMAHCNYSPLVNHMILHGRFTVMLGEFLVRVFHPTIKLVAAMAEVFESPSSAGADADADAYPAADPDTGAGGVNATELAKERRLFSFLERFRSQTQLYLSLALGDRPNDLKLLESHRMFLEAFTSNSIQQLRHLFDNTKCQCVQRLFLCGFNYAENNSTLLLDGGNVGTYKLLDKIPHHPDPTFEMARWFVHKVFIDNDPFVKQAADQKRLEFVNSLDKSKRYTLEEAREFKIIGLTQRSGRRQWRGLGHSKQACNREFLRHKICCVEINLEKNEMESPVKHLITHAALDGMVGIHGAQLTEALLMPPGSLVVEFLPWVLEGLKQGRWTTKAHSPTPLGVMFTNTDLNHIGYPLGRDSTSHIQCNRTGSDILGCFTPRNNRWDTREFSVRQDVVVDIIDKFVMQSPSTCSQFQTNSGDDYVLYNVICSDGNGSDNSTDAKTVHHFYRPANWVDDKVKSAIKYYPDPKVEDEDEDEKAR